MLVSEWATKYWDVSTVTKKTLYDYKSVFGRVISPHFGHLDLDAVVLMDVQKMVLSTSLQRLQNLKPLCLIPRSL